MTRRVLRGLPIDSANPWTRRRFLEAAIAAVPAVAAMACGSTVGASPDASVESGSEGEAGLDAGAEGAAVDADASVHCSTTLPRLDLRADCGAVGDGQTNDTAAFQKAATLIQQAGGSELVIPAGVYVVGKQTVKSGANAPGPWYQAADIFTVKGLACLKISGYGATVRVQPGLHYGGFNPKTGQAQDYTGGSANEAAIGRIFGITGSQNVLIEGLEIDGSNESLILGGQAGNVDRQVAATGIYLDECDDVTVVDVHTHHHALDGIAVEYRSGPPPKKMPHQLLRVVSEYNGRQGISWIGGWGLECIDCKFNHTGRAMNGGVPMTSKPGDGLDIEPNAGTTQQSRDGVFTRCEFVDNIGNGVEAANGDGGYSTFDQCIIWGTTKYSMWVVKPGMKFTNCDIRGSMVRGSDGRTQASAAPNAALAMQFEDCTFEDAGTSNDPRVYRENALCSLSAGYEGMSWKRCTFITHAVKAVDIGNPATAEIFDSCTFIHGDTGLGSGALQSRFTGCTIKSCHFEESSALSAGTKSYAIGVTAVTVAPPSGGGAATHVDGPKVKWSDAVSGQTGDIAPGTYA